MILYDSRKTLSRYRSWHGWSIQSAPEWNKKQQPCQLSRKTQPSVNRKITDLSNSGSKPSVFDILAFIWMRPLARERLPNLRSRSLMSVAMGSWNLSPERGKCDGAQGPTGCLYAIRTGAIKHHDHMQIVKLSSNGSHLHVGLPSWGLQWSAWDGHLPPCGDSLAAGC